MYPVLFSIYDIDILSLSVFLVLAFVVFNLVLYRLIPVKELNILFWNKYLFIISLATIIGARLAYVATFFDKISFVDPFFSNLGKNLYLLFNPDGFSFYGGIIMFFLMFLLLSRKKESFWPWMDLFTVAFFAWLTIASIGFFLGGIYYGSPTSMPWGIVIDNIYSNVKYTTPIHPVQLYAAAASFLTFMALYITYRHKTWTNGILTFVGAGCLALIDFITNFFRGDDTLFVNILRFDQWLDLGVLTIALIALFYFYRTPSAPHR